ncbi:RAI1 like PD-XK nuclease-domain-containing protein [Kockovaella imperatae]|uniref:Decapping nuclease n=1 Tax=Kockovaella imperatae TaxID=4999 RepID=A0A1Y1UMU2_9TREE|nr:RAI1 like PD-XK nuclease-domain-containing protein [Kockovaella imperatae]ORX39312.1 RAI1 like PD-XK nuclease-domain-containing protein [Kockovaella imperatae]
MNQAYPEANVHTFLPLPPRSLTAPPPPYHLPTLIGTYSHLSDRTIVHDDTSMPYYRKAPVGCDLNYGFERRIERDEDLEEHLDGLCESLMEIEQRNGRPALRQGSFITWRGMITRIMTAPFEERDGWEMTAIPLGGSIYVELHDPPDVRQRRRKEQSSWAWQSYMGYSFESFSTFPPAGEAQSPDWPQGWSGDVNQNIQWCNIVRSAIGDIPLCLGGEVDCVNVPPGSPHPGLLGCMELKTNKVIENQKQDIIFNKKLLKHWAQSFLLGVPTVEVGFRDDDGILRSQTSFETVKIPRLVAAIPQPPWSPAPCFHFLHAVLNLVLTHVLPTDPTPKRPLQEHEPLPDAMVWRFSFVPRRGCELYKVGTVKTAHGRWGGVLKEDFVRWRMTRS